MSPGSKAASTGARSNVRVPELIQVQIEDGEPVERVLRGALAAAQPHVPPRFFYDELGSRLFAAITSLDEYYPTRTEAALMARHGDEIGAACRIDGGTLIDLGAGNCEKAARLIPALRPAQYVAVDISVEFLQQALTDLKRRYPALDVLGVGTDFSTRLSLPPGVLPRQRLFFYPGSSIGNFAPDEATALLQQLRQQCDAQGGVLIGVDLQKERGVLERAYDDSLGVTAAFNRNVLRHVNRLAGTDFDVADWRHVAFWAEADGRVEMHLEAVRPVAVTWPGGSRRFAAGERIHTENSYKYTLDGFEQLLQRAGLRSDGRWTDERQWFAVFLARPQHRANS